MRPRLSFLTEHSADEAPVIRHITGKGCSHEGMRLARQLPEALRVASAARTALYCPPGAGVCDGRHRGLCLARLHMAGLGSQGALFLPSAGRFRAVQRLTGSLPGRGLARRIVPGCSQVTSFFELLASEPGDFGVDPPGPFAVHVLPQGVHE